MAAYGTYPKEGGGTPTRVILPYAFTLDALKLIKRAPAFLYEIKSINTPQLRPEAVMPEFTQAALKERGRIQREQVGIARRDIGGDGGLMIAQTRRVSICFPVSP